MMPRETWKLSGAIRRQRPARCEERTHAVTCLMADGADQRETARRGADEGDKILTGANPRHHTCRGPYVLDARVACSRPLVTDTPHVNDEVGRNGGSERPTMDDRAGPSGRAVVFGCGAGDRPSRRGPVSRGVPSCRNRRHPWSPFASLGAPDLPALGALAPAPPREARPPGWPPRVLPQLTPFACRMGMSWVFSPFRGCTPDPVGCTPHGRQGHGVFVIVDEMTQPRSP
jgi:hypothetical protein